MDAELLVLTSLGFAVTVATISIVTLWLAYRRNVDLEKEIDQLRSQVKVLEPETEKERAHLEQSESQDLRSSVDDVSKGSIDILADGDLDLSGDFGQAYKRLNESDRCIFVTGKAGTGKSTLLQLFVANTKKKVALLAPTGIAAIKIRGETIHSFFRFPPRPIAEDEIRIVQDRELYRVVDTIVIDEISMVRADLMDAIDRFMRLNGRDRNRPFGGVQMLFFGDIFQLPPVVADKEEARFLASRYPSQYFFDAKVFSELPLETIELEQVFRQKNLDFVKLLDAVRMNQLTSRELDLLNSRCKPGTVIDDGMQCITLTTTNKRAATINAQRLAKIRHPAYTYMGTIEGDFPRTLPTDMALNLKKDAQVMFVKNDSSRRWVNGTIGKVAKLADGQVRVQVDYEGNCYVYSVEQESWEILKHKFEYSIGRINTEVVGRFTQYPLKLAWAVTIHKSQGLTFDNVLIDLGRGAFAHGQTYVALSRCTSLNGIILRNRINRSDIKVDNTVRAFYENAIVRRQGDHV